MTWKRHYRVLGLTACLLWSQSVCFSVSPNSLTGVLLGKVSNPAGAPQLGAAVFIYNRVDKLVEKALTREDGSFTFSGLLPDEYTIRVVAATFVPAVRSNIGIQAGRESILNVNLASLFSSIEIVPMAPGSSPLMSDDWKWVLRSSVATRPILRLLPGLSQPHATTASAAIFADTRGLLRFSAGDTGPLATATTQTDLGTAFALATSVFGANQLQVSANVGYASHSGLPTAAFRTTFGRPEAGGNGPQINVTVRQLMLPGRAGLLGTVTESGPMLRTFSLGAFERNELTDHLTLEYGFDLEAVSYLERVNYVSPFARGTYTLGPNDTLQIAYSSGAPPVSLLSAAPDQDSWLQQDLAALGAFPRVTRRDGAARIQRTGNFEVGYRHASGPRTFSFGVHREQTRNAALTLSGASDLAISDELLPDLSSRSYIYNIGDYRSLGVTASVTQKIDDHLSVLVAAGSGGGLRTDSRTLLSDNAADIRSLIHGTRRYWLAGQLVGVLPGTGTRYRASYQWTDYRSLTPSHAYLTQAFYADAGLNFQVRQPLPGFGLVPGRLEASAEVRNALAQGYLPLATESGQRLLLIHSPRAVRGGVSFIF